jgi:hypothetical protein
VSEPRRPRRKAKKATATAVGVTDAGSDAGDASVRQADGACIREAFRVRLLRAAAALALDDE